MNWKTLAMFYLRYGTRLGCHFILHNTGSTTGSKKMKQKLANQKERKMIERKKEREKDR